MIKLLTFILFIISFSSFSQTDSLKYYWIDSNYDKLIKEASKLIILVMIAFV